MPAEGSTTKTREVRELSAHATALPWFRYLLADPLDAVVLGRSAVVPVRVPRPERLAWHKLLVAGLRGASNDKRAKHMDQAAVLVAVLAEREAGALEDALRHLPRAARKTTKAMARRISDRLEGHPRAAETLRHLVA